MKKPEKKILLKISGELFAHPTHMQSILQQIKDLTHAGVQFGIVLGGGNFFRGSRQSSALGISQTTGDTVGMLATVMNGLIMRDLLHKIDINAIVLSAFTMPQITQSLSPEIITQAQKSNLLIIFVGGTGNPYFSTDTNAIIRALQINADEVWKATNVDSIYSGDPKKDSSSKPIKTISYNDVLSQQLGVIDATAITLAREHKLPIRVFNIFAPDALQEVNRDKNFGSTVCSTIS